MERGFLLSAILIAILVLIGTFVSVIMFIMIEPFSVTPFIVLKELIDYMDLKSGERLVDFGSGDGRVIFEATKTKDVLSKGYEISPLLIIWSKFMKLFRFGFSNKVKIEVDSYMNSDLKDVDVVYLHMSHKGRENLSDKLSELKLGSRIFSYKYELFKREDLKFIESKELSNGTKLFSYIKA